MNLPITIILSKAKHKTHQTNEIISHVKAHTNKKKGYIFMDFALLPGCNVLVGPLVAEVGAAQQACRTDW